MISFINGLCVILEHNMACVFFSLISFVSYTGLQNWSLTVLLVAPDKFHLPTQRIGVNLKIIFFRFVNEVPL